MKRSELEHLIRAAAVISGDDELIIIGSQAILGQFPEAPESLRVSMEADLYPKNLPERWDLIDGSIGEASYFHQTFGYYAQGVGPETAVLPVGWERRLIAICNANTRGATGFTLEVHDLLVAKLIAGRPKDIDFAQEAFGHGLADPATVLERLQDTPVDASIRQRIIDELHALPTGH